MNNNSKIKIRISNNAYDFVSNLLKFHTEYDCVSLEENISSKCCKSPKIQIGLNNAENFDILNKIENISFCYNLNLCNNVKEVTIVLKDSTLHAKITTINENFKSHNCNNCGKRKGNCTGCT